MMNTFFFGYFPLKWRRLVRFFAIVPAIISMCFVLYYIYYDESFFYSDRFKAAWFVFNTPLFIVSPILSWLLKPFGNSGLIYFIAFISMIGYWFVISFIGVFN